MDKQIEKQQDSTLSKQTLSWAKVTEKECRKCTNAFGGLLVFFSLKDFSNLKSGVFQH